MSRRVARFTTLIVNEHLPRMDLGPQNHVPVDF